MTPKAPVESLDSVVSDLRGETEAFPAGVDASPEAKLRSISDLAKTKLGIIDPESIKEKVMEATGLAFLEVNYDKIIESLTNKF